MSRSAQKRQKKKHDRSFLLEIFRIFQEPPNQKLSSIAPTVEVDTDPESWECLRTHAKTGGSQN